MLFYPSNEPPNTDRVTVIPQYRGKWLFLRRKGQTAIEFPLGRKKEGESLTEAAQRVLHEESGAADFSLWPVAYYGVIRGNRKTVGQLFYASVGRLNMITNPMVEERIFLGEAEEMGHNTLHLQWMEKTEKWLTDNRTLLYFVASEGKNYSRLSRSLAGSYIDYIYVYPEKKIRDAFASFAEERRLKLTEDEDLGGEGAVLFSKHGPVVFRELLEKGNKCSTVLGVHSDMLQELSKYYREFLQPVNQEYSQTQDPAGRASRREQRGKQNLEQQDLQVLRLAFIGEILIGAGNTWTNVS
ncbi:MAG: hypothetical protein FWH28_05755 [Clostridiales bacterium]|nr:hypothetical protein [Clostridiales bacterium]